MPQLVKTLGSTIPHPIISSHPSGFFQKPFEPIDVFGGSYKHVNSRFGSWGASFFMEQEAILKKIQER